MTWTVVKRVADGATVVSDDGDNVLFVLRPGQWEEIEHLPDSERRHRAEQFVIANKRDTSGDRTQAEEEAREMTDQGQGERHSDQEGH